MMDARVAPRFRFWSDEQTARLPPGIGGSESAPEVTHVLRNGGKRAVSGHRRAWSRPVIPDSVSAQRLDQTRLGSRQQLESMARSQPGAAAILSAASISMPMTCPVGVSRSCPWHASRTSQASCSWWLIRACPR
jgi:hypothetical protein